MKDTQKKRPRQGTVAVRTHGGPAPRLERVPVLIVAAADGWFDVFAPEHVNVVFRNRLAIGCPEGASLCDEYVSLSLPKPHRELYDLSRPRLSDQVRRVTPSDEAERLMRLELVQAVRELGQTPQAVPA